MFDVSDRFKSAGDAGVPDKMIRHLNRRCEELVARRLFGIVMIENRENDLLGNLVAAQIMSADAAVIPSDELAFHAAKFARRARGSGHQLPQLVRKCIGHDDLAHVVQQTHKIIGVVVNLQRRGREDFTRDDGGRESSFSVVRRAGSPRRALPCGTMARAGTIC